MPPNFFIVGAPKAGTTSLYRYLDQHPQIYMSPVKEPCHFAPEVMPANFSPEYRNSVTYDAREMQAYLRGPKLEKRFSGYVPEWADYLSLFEGAKKELAIGEASVCYLWSPTAARNISARLPHARIVALLRHPAERAWSQYLHGVANGHVTKSLREHIEACLKSPGKRFSPVYPFLEFGMYSRQIRTYFDLFPRENVRVCFYQDGLAHVVTDILGFLNVDAEFQVDLSGRHLDSSTAQTPTAVYRTLAKYQLWQRLRKFAPRRARSVLRKMAFSKRPVAQMNDSDRRFLCEYYREDVLHLAALLERDLTSWLI
jgi:Sulfotransferase family